MMSRFLKPKVLQKKTVAELLKLDMKHSDSQLKDSELEIGLPTRQALNRVPTAPGKPGKMVTVFPAWKNPGILSFLPNILEK